MNDSGFAPSHFALSRRSLSWRAAALLVALLAALPAIAPRAQDLQFSSVPVFVKPKAAPPPATVQQQAVENGPQAPGADAPAGEDRIVAVVNQEPITLYEVQRRVDKLLHDAPAGAQIPPVAELRRQVLDALIDERAQISHAKAVGVRVSDADVDRAIQSIAAENQLTGLELRGRLQKEGVDYDQFRRTIRDRLLLERVRDAEVIPRIQISDADIDHWLADHQFEGTQQTQDMVAHILIALPDNATAAQAQAAQAKAESVLALAKSGVDFDKLARLYSDDATTRDDGGKLGWRRVQLLPDLFAKAVEPLQPGQVAPELVRSGAGWHVIKLVDRKTQTVGPTAYENRVRHILIRPSGTMTLAAAKAELSKLRQMIVDGEASFAQLARQYSQDASATQGGDLGWAKPGQYVPEFEQAVNALHVGEISQPVVSRFGVHLIQVMERRELKVTQEQLREAARSALQAQGFEAAYKEWAREVRAQAYVDLRDTEQ
jgi:peptidyl-prolyl cis-trans isomerase SurA